jgi:hypothetical protein
MRAAEEILRTIYGDDFAGCKVSLDQIAIIIEQAIRHQAATDLVLLDLYEKLVEAMNLLSTPPDSSKVVSPEDLRALLNERLDAIRGLTLKTLQTTARLKAVENGDDSAAH